VAIDREKVLVAAQKFVEKKKYDKAVAEYQKVIQEDPNDARTLLKIGDLQSKMEAYADAVATYERVGRFYSSQGFALKAIAVYKQIREIIAKHVPGLEDRYSHLSPKLAELYQQLGLTSDALAALDEVATRLQRQNRDQEAIEVCRKIVELDPANPLPHLRLAEAFSRAKDTESAVGEFGLAAGQLVKMGRVDDALKVLERLLHHKADPTYARIAAEQHLARNAANDGMQALSKLQVAFQANPRDLDTLGLLARAFTTIGQAAKAIEVQKEMARIARDSGKRDLFREILARLQKLVPNDEAVRLLATASLPPEPASVAPPRVSEPPVSISAESYEVSENEIEEGEIEETSSQIVADGDLVMDDVEVAEEIREEETAERSAEQLAHILAEAAAYRRATEHGKAIESLRIGLEVDPRSIALHEALRDLLFEAGRVDEAIPDLMNLASLQVEALDGDAAARTLQEVLSVDPSNARALEMLHELGYEIPEEPLTDVKGAPDIPMRGEYVSYDPEAPLPSYDLDESSAPSPEVAALPFAPASTRNGRPAAPPAELPGSIDGMDDPFGAEAPLPSFPLDSAVEPALDSAVELSVAKKAPTEPPPRSIGSATVELESALEEAEFFTSRGLYDDARTILEEQLSRLPNNKLLRERIAELDAQERAVPGDSGTRPTPAGAVEDRSFDIAESLGALDGGDRASGVGPSFEAPSEQVDVEEVFAKFKEGVAKQIDVDDGQGHYDLGIAYKEMALLDDAIREFETAARDQKRACICHSMIGMIELERGNLNEAIDAFMRGLKAPGRSKEQEASLTYEIGAAYEVKKMAKLALDYFQRTARLMPSFRDVQERIRRLQRVEPKQPVRAVAVGADDEFDRAFDDILGGGKLP
jgi:tetratricopeptide (TPR) repeat protein